MVFRKVRNTMPSETETFRSIITQLDSVLPTGWEAELERRRSRNGPDAIFKVRSPDGENLVVAVEFRTSVQPRQVPDILAQLKSYSEASAYMVATPFLAPRTRQVLAEAGAGYADATGNLRLATARPALLLLLEGADRNPAPEADEPLRSLKGSTAGRVVRAVCDFRPPYGVRELAERSGTAVASVWRVLSVLEREALVSRGPARDKRRGGPIVSADWANLIQRWTQDYGLTRSNKTELVLAPRGFDDMLERLRLGDLRYAVTGSLAATHLAPVAPPRLAAVYVDDLMTASEQFGFRPASAGGNVIFAEPFDDVVFERTWDRDGLIYAAPSQVAADLITGPGRAPSEAAALLTWMAENESAWRS